VSDADDSTPAVWDPTARGGAGGWVRHRRTARADVPEPSREPSPEQPTQPQGNPPAAPAGTPDAADEAPTALLPRVPEQPEQPDPTLVRPYLPTFGKEADAGADPGRAGDPMAGLPLFRPEPGSGSGSGSAPGSAPGSEPGYGAEPQEQTRQLRPVAPPPPGYAPYTRPSPGRPSPGQPGGGYQPPGPPEAAPVPERRRMNPLLLVLAAVVVVVLVGVLAVRAMSGSTKSPGAATPAPPVSTPAGAPAATGGSPAAPGTGTGTGPSASASASASTGSGSAQSEAAAVDQLLGQSSSSRQQVIDAVAQVSQCSDPASVAAAQTALTQAAASRQALVTRLGALDMSQVQGGAQAVQVLSKAWSESATADSDYAAWAGAMSHGGCSPNSAQPDSDYADAGTQSGDATNDKNTFIDLWTPIAMQYGLPTRTADAI